jgi:hypothetical protein
LGELVLSSTRPHQFYSDPSCWRCVSRFGHRSLRLGNLARGLSLSVQSAATGINVARMPSKAAATHRGIKPIEIAGTFNPWTICTADCLTSPPQSPFRVPADMSEWLPNVRFAQKRSFRKAGFYQTANRNVAPSDDERNSLCICTTGPSYELSRLPHITESRFSYRRTAQELMLKK